MEVGKDNGIGLNGLLAVIPALPSSKSNKLQCSFLFSFKPLKAKAFMSCPKTKKSRKLRDLI